MINFQQNPHGIKLILICVKEAIPSGAISFEWSIIVTAFVILKLIAVFIYVIQGYWKRMTSSGMHRLVFSSAQTVTRCCERTGYLMALLQVTCSTLQNDEIKCYTISFQSIELNNFFYPRSTLRH